MSDSPPPGVAAGAAGPAPPALTPAAIDAVLADFRAWLTEAAAESDEAPPAAARAPAWMRWLGWRAADAAEYAAWKERQEARGERAREARESAEGARRTLAALIDGYTMGLQRIDRALAQHGL